MIHPGQVCLEIPAATDHWYLCLYLHLYLCDTLPHYPTTLTIIIKEIFRCAMRIQCNSRPNTGKVQVAELINPIPIGT